MNKEKTHRKDVRDLKIMEQIASKTTRAFAISQKRPIDMEKRPIHKEKTHRKDVRDLKIWNR